MKRKCIAMLAVLIFCLSFVFPVAAEDEWCVGYIVDEFGDPTGELIIKYFFTGADGLSGEIVDYGMQWVIWPSLKGRKANFGAQYTEKSTFKIKIDGEVYQPYYRSEIYIDEKTITLFYDSATGCLGHIRKALSQGKTVSVSIHNNYMDENYVFKIQTKGYEEAVDTVCATKYLTALSQKEKGDFQQAIKGFEFPASYFYKDSDTQIIECQTFVTENKYQAALALFEKGEYKKAKEAFEKLGTYKDSKMQATNCENAIQEQQYQAALVLYNTGEYKKAQEAFIALGSYKDSAAQVQNCTEAIRERDYDAALALFNERKYEEAKAAFAALGSYKDSAAQVRNCTEAICERKYNAASALFNEGKYEEAKAAFTALGSYKDSADKAIECDYQAAIADLNEGRYKKAQDAFTALGSYKDSADMVFECDYQKAKAMYDNGNYNGAYDAFTAISGYKDVDSLLATDEHLLNVVWPGKILTFGTYAGKPVEWQVLEVKKDGSCILLSVKCLDAKPYNTEYADVTWETCSLRAWLNGEFYESVFSASEKEKTVLSSVQNQNPNIDSYKAIGGNTTKDYVYLLSYNEVKQYLPSFDERICYKMANAEENSRGVNWWLRTPGHMQSYAAQVTGNGSIRGEGVGVGYEYAYVRPVVCVRF